MKNVFLAKLKFRKMISPLKGPENVFRIYQSLDLMLVLRTIILIKIYLKKIEFELFIF